MTEEHLIADLVATFPGIHAKPAAEFSPEYLQGVWVGGDGTVTLGDMPMFCCLECPDPDHYNGNVLHAFEAWLEARGYWLEHYDSGVYFAIPWQPELSEAVR